MHYVKHNKAKQEIIILHTQKKTEKQSYTILYKKSSKHQHALKLS